jgi:hypothetical protein
MDQTDDKVRIARANNACVVCGDVLAADPLPPHCDRCDPEDPDVEWCEQTDPIAHWVGSSFTDKRRWSRGTKFMVRGKLFRVSHIANEPNTGLVDITQVDNGWSFTVPYEIVDALALDLVCKDCDGEGSEVVGDGTFGGTEQQACSTCAGTGRAS